MGIEGNQSGHRGKSLCRKLLGLPLLFLAAGGLEEGLDHLKHQAANPFEGVEYSAILDESDGERILSQREVICHLQNSQDFRRTTLKGTSVNKRAKEWTSTIYDALNQIGIPVTKKNLEYALILMHRESRMDTNPRLDVSNAYERKRKGLIAKIEGKVSEGTNRDRLVQAVNAVFDRYEGKINRAENEEEVYYALLDINNDLDIPAEIGQWLIPYDPWDEKIADLQDQMQVNTLGVLQVDTEVARKFYASKGRTLDDIATVDYLFHLLPNLKVGLAIFFTALEEYKKMGFSEREAIKFAFADYNAGIYSSRNAAFQKMVAELTGVNLALDGDLLIYEHDGVSDTRSQTEGAVQKLFPDQNIRPQLVREKAHDFNETNLYSVVLDRYRARNGEEIALALVPDAADDQGADKHGGEFNAAMYVRASMRHVRGFTWKKCR